MSGGWKAQVGHALPKSTAGVDSSKPKASNDNSNDDDWETGDFVNDVSEKQTRWGSKSNPVTMESKGVAGDETGGKLSEVRDKVIATHNAKQAAEYASKSFSRGYGGAFGVEGKDNKDAKDAKDEGQTK
ncbi:Hematopoietic lineage cell-specific protein [Sorochytrium milnesiophthora]